MDPHSVGPASGGGRLSCIKVVVAPAQESLATAYECVRPIIDGIDQLSASLTPAERSTVAEFLEAVVHVYEKALRDAK